MELFWGTTTKYKYTPEMTDSDVINLLGKWRGENCLKHKTELGRALSFCAGMTLKDAFIKRGLNIYENNPLLGDNGKPLLEGVEFNLSHSGKVALVAVSGDLSPVGCDVQRVEKKEGDKVLAIAKRFFSVNEHEKMQDLMQKNPELTGRLFYLIFSAKEAYIKMTGEGMKRAMNSFEIPLDDEIFNFLGNKNCPPLKKIAQIDGQTVAFSYYFPDEISRCCGQNDLKEDYVAVICNIEK